MKYSGGLVDDRKEKKDFSHLEIGRSVSPAYLTKSKALKVIDLYEKRDQKRTSSCGAHAGELAHSIDTGKKHEQAFIYRLRKNYDSEGMFHYDIGDILSNNGACEFRGIEKSEPVYNAFDTKPYIEEALKYRQKGYVVLENDKFTIDDIAYIVNDLKRPLILFVYWKDKEWDTDFPVANGKLTTTDATYRHYVTVLPNSAYIEKGKKYVIIQDSAWFGDKNIRHLSEEWIDKRIYTGLYFRTFEKSEPLPVKTLPFTKNFGYGDRDPEIIRLQIVLQAMGFFPKDVEATGYFGGITRQAVKDFQKKYEKSILWVLGLKLPTGYFGNSTRKKLNELIK